MLTALSSIGAQRGETEPIVVAARDLPSGVELSARDVQRVRIATDLVPAKTATEVEAVVGKRLSGPVRRGEAVTDVRLLGSGALNGRPAGTVIATLRIADPVELEGIEVGDRVDIVAVRSAEMDGQSRARKVAENVEVVATDPDPKEGDAPATLRVATSEKLAVKLAEAAVDARLGVIAVAR